jgi:hypothetical protein
MSMGQGAMQPRRMRPRPGGATPILTQQPPGPPPGTMAPGTPPPPSPVGQGENVQAGAMGDYRNALLRRMQMQGQGGAPLQPGAPPQGAVPGGMPTPGGMPGMGAPQPPQNMQGGPDGVAGLIQNLLRTRNSRRVLGGASGPLGQ